MQVTRWFFTTINTSKGWWDIPALDVQGRRVVFSFPCRHRTRSSVASFPRLSILLRSPLVRGISRPVLYYLHPKTCTHHFLNQRTLRRSLLKILLFVSSPASTLARRSRCNSPEREMHEGGFLGKQLSRCHSFGCTLQSR